jgi:hypothetical protein
MGFGLSNRGQELLVDGGLVGETVEVTLYLDSSDIDQDGTNEGDDLVDSDDLTAVSTEPAISRILHTIVEGDTVNRKDDFTISFSETFDVAGVADEVDGVLLIERGTTDIVGRLEIQDQEPSGLYQSLNGLTALTVEPQFTLN